MKTLFLRFQQRDIEHGAACRAFIGELSVHGFDHVFANKETDAARLGLSRDIRFEHVQIVVDAFPVVGNAEHGLVFFHFCRKRDRIAVRMFDRVQNDIRDRIFKPLFFDEHFEMLLDEIFQYDPVCVAVGHVEFANIGAQIAQIGDLRRLGEIVEPRIRADIRKILDHAGRVLTDDHQTFDLFLVAFAVDQRIDQRGGRLQRLLHVVRHKSQKLVAFGDDGLDVLDLPLDFQMQIGSEISVCFFGVLEYLKYAHERRDHDNDAQPEQRIAVYGEPHRHKQGREDRNSDDCGGCRFGEGVRIFFIKRRNPCKADKRQRADPLDSDIDGTQNESNLIRNERASQRQCAADEHQSHEERFRGEFSEISAERTQPAAERHECAQPTQRRHDERDRCGLT